jgi:MarR family transcriptional regulator, organic hydroperoxide resistance regulator
MACVTKDDSRYPLGRALDFLERTWRVNHAMQRVSTRMGQEIGITGPQRLVIRCIGKFPGIAASQLADLLHLDRGTISSALNRLEQRRLIRRGSDPVDRRRVTLGLTERGREFDRPTPHTIEAVVEQTLATIGDDELAVTARVLGALADALEQEADRAR